MAVRKIEEAVGSNHRSGQKSRPVRRPGRCGVLLRSTVWPARRTTTMSSDLTRLADRISRLSPEKKDHLAELLRSDRILVTAIVRHSHFKQIIDLCLKMLAIVSNTRLAWVLREELAYRKRKRDRKPDPEQLERNEVIRAEQKAGKTIGQLAKKYHLTRQRIQQIVREKVSSN
jgi:menaquinone-dependent protoporphyrinogen IX oxidase